ncbi:MAG: hypothetical protein M2R45_01624 [Verrucomicrobia subdivision 3 bacterium]|nr:hypothetical protein [Limisphaerales bacterium]MCS1412775.1 hypothetical protein [Limisphaerales bacterium]
MALTSPRHLAPENLELVLARLDRISPHLTPSNHAQTNRSVHDLLEKIGLIT